MDFDWTEEQRTYHDVVASFARDRLTDDVLGRDAEHAFSVAAWRECAEIGIQGLPVPEEYGGSGADAMTIMLALEALGYGCKDNGLIFALNAQMWACEVPLVRFGSEEQKRRHLPGLCDGSTIGAQGMSEPESGSDAMSLTTTAEKRGDGYVLNGRKTFVTNAPEADFLLVYASTDPGMGFAGLSAFLIGRGTRGLSIGQPLEKMGLRTSSMSELFLDDCEIAKEQLLGKPGSGMAIFNVAMQWERSCILASTVGAMQRQLERCITYARERRQSGKPIGKFQAVSHRIADMKVRLETARLLIYRLAWLLERGAARPHDAALAKLYLSECYLQSSLDALQVHGGYGYMAEYELEREVRDAVGTRIHSGTSDIQRNIIAGSLGL
ncbi:MAG: acyl-CoA dehydrogenase family protein [Actinomycetota bacterium]|nr:acyl-CoA dehydrogenase family protein [Actinomycetota bacterium]